ncbi:hypothetical protein [Paenibacillus qinlingensis]|uniref:Uncharacterized protein n=1 Tax=Paenibacillus qinlingensis TaxID=1837343 RepID=A0ABU1P1N2_9BACL|nr:hypothetical protein [Paenibacillus qinlingensis]MDR6553469.1 hypothetical protein [Paenibacillus qinlingensis]
MKRIKMNTVSKALLIVLALSIAVQTGYTLVSYVHAQTVAMDEEAPKVPTTETGATSIDQKVIPQDVLNKLQATDSSHFDSNVMKYKQLLADLNVHAKVQQEIERLVMAGHSLSNVLIAFEFLYQKFGKLPELELLVKQKEAGKAWEALFAGYNSGHKAFVPRAFDPDYLEDLMKKPGFTSDDVMMADRVSFASGIDVKDIITSKLESKRNWMDITAELDLLHGTATLPRVQITAQQLSKFVKPGSFTEDKIAEAFVLAQQIGQNPETVVEKMKAGKTEAAIRAESYMLKYN